MHASRPTALWVVPVVAALLALMLSGARQGLAQGHPAGKGADVRFPTTTKAEYLANGSAQYTNDRNQLVTQHRTSRFCADEILNDDERALDERLRKMMTDAVRKFPTLPFDQVKAQIEQSPLFPLLQAMPKGGLLHVHLSAIGSMDWILTNAVALTNCYVQWPKSEAKWGTLNFYPSGSVVPSNYVRVSELANTDANFLTDLRARLTIDSKDFGPHLWTEFGDIFERLNGFVRNEAVFTNYLFEAFEQLWRDGVYYVEVRDSFAELQSEPGKELQPGSIVRAFLGVRERMKSKYEFFDCRLIVTAVRVSSSAAIAQKLADTVRLRRQNPGMVVGFDLIASEDLAGAATQLKVLDVLDRLRTVQAILATNAANAPMDAEAIKFGYGGEAEDLPYYLHDGESAWADNDNLFDAVLLQAPRIGHGFNLFRYPTLYPAIAHRGTALEICPISNQMLNLTSDLRIHPAHGYLNAGIQCVLATDDPAIFGNDKLTFEFWQALVAWNLDLAALKRLARNSILHSGLEEVRKRELEAFWNGRWTGFIQRQKHALQSGK